LLHLTNFAFNRASNFEQRILSHLRNNEWKKELGMAPFSAAPSQARQALLRLFR
jgi:hypothetical protein